MRAPATGGAAVVLAGAVGYLFQTEAPLAPEGHVMPEPVAEIAAAAPPKPATVGEMPAPEPAEPPATSPATFERAPLPGETPTTPMADLVTERQNMIRRAGAGGPGDEFPPDIVAGELEFAAEPIDRTWAPGAEARVFAAFAQIPGLRLIDQQVECRSTMCRVQLTQPGSAVTNGDRVPFNILRDSIGLEPRWMMMVGAGSNSLRSVGYFWRQGFAPRREIGEPREAD